MISYPLVEIDFSQIEDKPTVYQIKNVLNGKVFISSTVKFRKHLKALLTSLDRSLSRNPKELNSDYQKYGPEFFRVEVLEEVEIIDDQDKLSERMIYLKEKFLSLANRLYNVKMNGLAGGYETLSEKCYLLDLKGNIVEEFKSIQSAFKSLGITPHYAGKNTPSVVDGRYRIVTQEFYKNNKVEILSWPHYTDLSKYMADVYKKSIVVSAVINGKIRVFSDSAELAKELKKTREAIRLILKGETKSNPYNIQYVNPEARIEFKHLKELKEIQKKRNKQRRKEAI